MSRLRGSGGLALVFTLAVMLLPQRAYADTAESDQGFVDATPGTVLTVTPSDGLVDGQLVTVQGAGFDPTIQFGSPPSVVLLECSSAQLICVTLDESSFVPIASDGSIGPTDVIVRNRVGSTACLASADCFLRALQIFPSGREAAHHLSFQSARPGAGCGDRNHIHDREAVCKRGAVA